ncbi:hypothetical protein l11_03140 [Neisseria weaveri LMG 5135]|nr:hypothetical protein l13_08820 [Neisseria weaveri ATCC 51223]EGV38867.1 hypothetical protein l11_03140 [Neisseria weaveri LMG 5135]
MKTVIGNRQSYLIAESFDTIYYPLLSVALLRLQRPSENIAA